MSPTQLLQLSREFESVFPNSQGENVNVISYMIFYEEQTSTLLQEAKLFLITYCERAALGDSERCDGKISQ